MPDLPKWVRQIPTMAYLYAMLAVAVLGAVSAFAYQQRQIGARNAELRQSRAAVDTLTRDLKAARAARLAAEAAAHRDSVALAASRRTIARAAVRTDSAVREAEAERARAIALAADSGATLGQLRGQLVTLSAATARADSAHAVERAAWAADTAKSNSEARSLRSALAAAKVENGKLTEINANLRHQVELVTRDRPGVVQRYVVPALAFAVGVGVGNR